MTTQMPSRRIFTNAEWEQAAAELYAEGKSPTLGDGNYGSAITERVYSKRQQRWEDEGTVAAFLAHYDCSAKCLCADTPDTECQCSCLGKWHGRLANHVLTIVPEG